MSTYWINIVYILESAKSKNCFAQVRILAERFLFHRTQFPMKQEDGQAEKERHTFLHTAQTSDCPHVHKQSPWIDSF